MLSRLGALKAAAPTLNAASRKTAFGTAYQARLGSTGALFPKLCRIGCLVLLLVLVGTALTSVNQYPDMKAVSALLAGAVRNTKNETENTSPGLIVEETVGWNSSDEMAQSAALDEATQAADFYHLFICSVKSPGNSDEAVSLLHLIAFRVRQGFLNLRKGIGG